MGRAGEGGRLPAIGWGIIGTGVIAEHFAGDLKRVPGASLVAVTSRSYDKAADFAVRHGAEVYRDLDSLLADPRVGALYIASPNDTHAAAAMAALSAGKGVMVEKPLVASSAEADKLAAFAAERGHFLMEAMWTRFLPAIGFVRETLKSGAIGDVTRIDGELAYLHPYDPANRFFDPAKGGGAMLDLGVYLISLSLALFGRPDKVEGQWRAAPTGVDMAANLELTFGSAEAHLNCAIDRNGANFYVIEGTKGALIIQTPFLAARQVFIAPRGAGRVLAGLPGGPLVKRVLAKVARSMPLPGVRSHTFDFPGYGLQFETEAAMKAIAEGQTGSPLAPLEDAIETLRIIEQVRGRPSA